MADLAKATLEVPKIVVTATSGSKITVAGVICEEIFDSNSAQ
jgi:hypothetical protein